MVVRKQSSFKAIYVLYKNHSPSLLNLQFSDASSVLDTKEKKRKKNQPSEKTPSASSQSLSTGHARCTCSSGLLDGRSAPKYSPRADGGAGSTVLCSVIGGEVEVEFFLFN